MKICQNLKLIIRNSKDDNFHRPSLPIRKGNYWLFGGLELNVAELMLLESLESQFAHVNCHWTAEGKLYVEFN